MSLNGSGRFLRRYDPRASFDSREGDQENPRVNFEPGSGAEFMYNAGWHNRDPYGNEIKVTPKRGGYDSYDEEESSSGMKFWLIYHIGISYGGSLWNER
ncbi:hypothetical protein L596_015647 [Steinernema carpocapsae]|uniref:Uncharacterized protein n=1 Tax=Steinernema carpocapsae TaxID=34508 RepID=A0A4U5NGG1_STECR|nr:hypothetical protein L596_015647 [Steinernema carpocapsae]